MDDLIVSGVQSTESLSGEFLHVNSCGKQLLSDKDYFTERPGGRIDYHFLYITSGCCYTEVNGALIKAEAGSLLLYRPKEKQKYIFYAKDKAESFWIHFTGTGCEDLLKNSGIFYKNYHYIGVNNEIKNRFLKIIRELQLKAKYFEDLCRSYLMELIFAAARCLSDTKDGAQTKNEKRFLNVIQSMHDNYQGEKDIEDYAKMCHLSKTRFAHLFKECTGIPPLKYQTGIRIEKAKELLLNTSLNVSEVSKAVGYLDNSYFTRIFKKYTGHPPGFFKNNPNHGSPAND